MKLCNLVEYYGVFWLNSVATEQGKMCFSNCATVRYMLMVHENYWSRHASLKSRSWMWGGWGVCLWVLLAGVNAWASIGSSPLPTSHIQGTSHSFWLIINTKEFPNPSQPAAMEITLALLKHHHTECMNIIIPVAKPLTCFQKKKKTVYGEKSRSFLYSCFLPAKKCA